MELFEDSDEEENWKDDTVKDEEDAKELRGEGAEEGSQDMIKKLGIRMFGIKNGGTKLSDAEVANFQMFSDDDDDDDDIFSFARKRPRKNPSEEPTDRAQGNSKSISTCSSANTHKKQLHESKCEQGRESSQSRITSSVPPEQTASSSQKARDAGLTERENRRNEAIKKEEGVVPRKRTSKGDILRDLTSRLDHKREMISQRPFFQAPQFLGDEAAFTVGHIIESKFDGEGEAIRKAVQDILDREDEEKSPRGGHEQSEDETRQQDGVIAIDEQVHSFIASRRSAQDAYWADIKSKRAATRERCRTLQEICLQKIRNHDSLFQALKNRQPPFHLVEDTFVESCLSMNKEISIPATINRYLQGFQREGAEFLCDIYTGLTSFGDDVRGGVLADEMGLGKTVQVIAFLAAIFGKTGLYQDQRDLFERVRDREKCAQFAAEGSVLIVVPESVENNWMEELERWGYFSVLHLGKLSNSSVKANAEEQLKDVAKGKVEIVVTGYHRMARLAMRSPLFTSIRWRLVVFDEVHRVKNPKTQIASGARKLKAPCKIGLTGTPMSNNLMELWGIMHVLSPMTFGPRATFREQFEKPISRGRKQAAQRHDLLVQQKAIQQLNATLHRLVKRRRKEVIKDKLHGKQDLMVLCPLTAKQERAYLRTLKLPDYRKVLDAVEKNKVVTRRISPEDELLRIPANMVHLDDTVDKNVNPGLPLWRLNHRLWKDHSEDNEEDEEATREAELSDNDMDMHVDPGASDEDDSRVVYKLEKHESSESDTEDEASRQENNGHVRRSFRTCLSCPLCMMMPFLLHLANISNHLELVRAPRVIADKGGNVSRLQRRNFRKRLRIAKLLLGDDCGRRGDIVPGNATNKDERNAPFIRSSKFENQIDDSQCGKLQVLRKLLFRWRAKAGIKVLIFSNSVVLLNVLEAYLASAGFPFVRLDGSTPKEMRQGLCRRFNEDPSQFCFLMSTKAGGEGLNLTGASKVIIFDPNWNPSADLQAQDRAFRIGQKRFVQVYRFISQGTIEEAKYLRQVDKQQLSSTILDESSEKRLFQDNEFRGVVELLRYSRTSFTLDINERYEQSRKRYMQKSSASESIRAPLVVNDSEDHREGDNFALVSLPQNRAQANEPDQDDSGEQVVEDIGESVNWSQLVGNSIEEMQYAEDVLQRTE